MTKFKIGFEDRIILTILGLSIAVIILGVVCVYQFIDSRNQAEINQFKEYLLEQNLKKINEERVANYKVIDASNKEIDRLKKQNDLYDNLLKETEKKYKIQHEKVSRINTYSSRQRYADSLANQMR